MNFPWTSDQQWQNSGQGQVQGQGQGQEVSLSTIFENYAGREGIQDIFSVMFTGTTGHNTGQDSEQPGLTNEAMAGCRIICEQGSGSGKPGLMNGAEANAGYDMICEEGSGSGLPQHQQIAPSQPAGKKRNGKAAQYSKNYRETKKKLEEKMKLEIEKLRKENEELRKNSRESNTKLDDLQARIRQRNERYIKLEEEYTRQQSQVDSLTKSLENMAYLQEENARLKTQNDRLTQQLNADTDGERLAKKSIKIPLENRYLKIKDNVLHLKRLD